MSMIEPQTTPMAMAMMTASRPSGRALPPGHHPEE
jgi:hypothetical protein